MRACREVGIGVGADQHLAHRTAIQSHLAGAKRHRQAVALLLEHDDTGMPRLRRTDLLRYCRVIRPDLGGHAPDNSSAADSHAIPRPNMMPPTLSPERT